MLLALQVVKFASFVGKIFMLSMQCSTTKTTNILPHENYPLHVYGSMFIGAGFPIHAVYIMSTGILREASLLLEEI